MKQYQREFIEFAIKNNVLTFGEFKLKSGRQSPYFFNAGLFHTGGALAQLGKFYAAALEDSQLDYDVLFGPAYKGIPLVSATAISLYEKYQKDAKYAFNRKEAKDHGEGGNIVGSPLVGRIFVIDDVITAGTAIRESVDIIKAKGATLCGVLVALDRQEKGNDVTSTRSAIAQVEHDLQVPVVCIVRLEHVVEYLSEKTGFEKEIAAIQAYRQNYGA